MVCAEVQVDGYKQQGTEVECGMPLCCRSNYSMIYNTTIQENPAQVKKKAGRWGAIGHCDIPYVNY